MLIVYAIITIDLPFASSLKGRRKIINSIKDRLKHHNMAVADLSGEYPKEAALALLFFAKSQNDANNKIAKIDELLAKYFGEVSYDIEYEILS